MTKKKWAHQPGEVPTHPRTKMENDLVELVDTYLSSTSSQVAVIHDNYEFVFFSHLDSNPLVPNKVDAFVYHNGLYVKLPPTMAKKASDAYFRYLDLASDAYALLDSLRGGEEK